MTRRYGIDTSILVRLTSGDPEVEFERCIQCLSEMVEREQAEMFASNQVVGESYIALQHHYGVSKTEARAALTDTLRSGLVYPLNGQSVLQALAGTTGCGLLDRLIADDYRRAELTILTLDKRMAGLEGARIL